MENTQYHSTSHLNGCHSTIVPHNRQRELVQLPKYGLLAWEYRFTRDCQYDKKQEDVNCTGCKEVLKELEKS